jgi:hypothetical protein
LKCDLTLGTLRQAHRIALGTLHNATINTTHYLVATNVVFFKEHKKKGNNYQPQITRFHL